MQYAARPAAPDQQAFWGRQRTLLDQMQTFDFKTRRYGEYARIQEAYNANTAAYDAALQASDPEAYAAAALEDEQQAAAHYYEAAAHDDNA